MWNITGSTSATDNTFSMRAAIDNKYSVSAIDSTDSANTVIVNQFIVVTRSRPSVVYM